MQKKNNKPISKRVLIWSSRIVIVLYLLSTLAPYFSSGRFWPIAILGLAYPIWLAILLLCIIIWGIIRSKWFFVCLITLLVGWRQVSVLFTFGNGQTGSVIVRKENSLRVMSWNVSRWDERNKELRGGQSYRSLMFDLIEVEAPDVLCFQEFFECNNPKYFKANIPELQKMGYPYYHFFPSFQFFKNTFQYGLAIFSKFPIESRKSYLNGARQHSEGIIFTDIIYKGQQIRIFNMHPESPGFGKEDFTDGGGLNPSKSMFQKIRRSYGYRNVQVDSAIQIIRQSPYPVIVCADLGDVPNSYAYFKFKKHFKDIFLEKGEGMGRTYRFFSPHLRIDYMFTSKDLSPYNYYIPKVKYSDHYPQIADIEVRSIHQ